MWRRTIPEAAIKPASARPNCCLDILGVRRNLSPNKNRWGDSGLCNRSAIFLWLLLSRKEKQTNNTTIKEEGFFVPTPITPIIILHSLKLLTSNYCVWFCNVWKKMLSLMNHPGPAVVVNRIYPLLCLLRSLFQFVCHHFIVIIII